MTPDLALEWFLVIVLYTVYTFGVGFGILMLIDCYKDL